LQPTLVFVNRYFYPDQSATSQMLTDLVRGLTAAGFAVHVVCSRQLYDDPHVQLPEREEVFGAQVRRIATTRFGRNGLLGRAIDYATFYVNCAWALLGLLKRGDVLIVKTDPPLMSLMAVPIAALKRAQLINWLQDVFPEVASRLGANPLPQWLDAILRRARNASLRTARMNVVIGDRMREYFTDKGIPACRLCVIENWADAIAIQPKPRSDSRLRARLGFSDRFVVCYSGNLGRAHEYETLLLAAEELKSDRAFAFLIIGGGAKTAALKVSVSQRALENFCFLPYQPRDTLEDSLAAADVHLVSLLPALEGMIVPSKLYGILAAGRPTIFIGEGDGEVARVLSGAECGITVAVGDSTGLAKALRRLRAEPDARAGMERRARQLVCEKFTPQRAIKRWMDLLEHPTPPERSV
jgi:colanic acid biosynthesis glycosyl transferase WcaI